MSLILRIKKYLYEIYKKISNQLIIYIDNFKPFIRKINYKGYIVYYSKGTSLIEINGSTPVRLGGVYEEQESEAIINELKKFDKPICLDIGANIGLITLNILARIPKAKIFAFEPGVHQNLLFKKTIEHNKLLDKVVLSNNALSYEPGEKSFAVHTSAHVSGDGFFDTGRAGEVNFITVSVTTLDNWWETASFPQINVVKIDTEGAELWILQGGKKFLSCCKPTIVFELYPPNLELYPYSAQDIVHWLNINNYTVETINGNSINAENLDIALQSQVTFIARYKDIEQCNN